MDDLERLAGWLQGPGGETRGRTIAERLRRLVSAGVLEDGARLPPERVLAARLGTGRATVAAAYDHLAGEGLLVRRQGSGTRVRRPAGAPPGPRGTSRMFAALGGVGGDVVDLSLAELDTGAATRRLLASLDGAALASVVAGTGYLPAGLPALREALAGWLATRRHPVAADEVVVTVGAQQAIDLATEVLAPPGATVLVEEATYPGALEVFRRRGLRAVAVPGDRHGPDPEALRTLAARLRPTLVFAIPVASNPLGRTWTHRRLDEVASVLAGTELAVIDDRTPAVLADHDLPPLATRLPGHPVVTVGSPNKIVWAGLRLGWAIAPPPLTQEIVSARIAADLGAPLLSQAVGVTLVPHLDGLAADARAVLAVRRRHAVETLRRLMPDWQVDDPGAGAWLWPRLPSPRAEHLCDVAERAGVLVTAGSVFAPDGGQRDRLRIAVVAEPAVLDEGLRRLAGAWHEGGGPAGRPARPAVVV